MRTQCLMLTAMLVACTPGFAQDAATAGKPQVKINYINVCDPSPEERAEMAAALARIPVKPGLSGDFEAARGRTTITPESLAIAASALSGAQVANTGESTVSHWVRLRRDFAATAFATAQYSLSYDEKSSTESFVFRLRDLKKDDIVQVALEDSITAGDPLQAVMAETPVDHVKVERFGKGSLGLRRCSNVDQTSLEPLFRAASEIANRYRDALGVKASVPGDLKRLMGSATRKSGKHVGPKAVGESKPAPAKSK